MNAKDINTLLRNNTGNKDKNSLIESFVVRTKPFTSIFNELKLSKTDKPEQNYLIIGQRGAGKTTLLYRLKYAIDDDTELNKNIIPVMFSEEQYHIMDLINFWENIAEHLEDEPGFKSLSKDVAKIDPENTHSEEIAYDLIQKALLANKKKVIVFIENVDVFFKKIGVQGQKRLREVLTTSTAIRLICSSTTYFDGVTNYSDPFYDFFKIIPLKGLSKVESTTLLLKLAEQKGESEQIQKVIEDHPKRLESLRRLSGGNPRIISYLFQIFLDNENGKAIVDLYKLLDDITLLYKAELDQLSAQQQKVIDIIARNWDAVSTREIAKKVNLDSKHISSILKTLEKNQIIESINTKTKNNLYRIKDRFLNIWYLMRFGKRREKENVIWLVRFYDTWCDKSELSQRISTHINDLKSGKYDMNAALDMGNVFLSCENVSPEVKLNLYKATKSLLPQRMLRELKLSKDSLFQSVKQLIKNGKFEEALDEIKDNKLDEMIEDVYEKKPSKELAFDIAQLFERVLQNIPKSIHYYKLALNQKEWKAAFCLGQIYFYDLDDLPNSEKYHRIAIENGENDSIMALATIFFVTDELEKSKDLVELAISKGDNDAKTNLAVIYQRLNQFDVAVSILKEAAAEGVNHALLSLGSLYMEQENPDFKKAEESLKEAIKKGETKAYYLLGNLLLKEDKEKEAESYFLEGVKEKDQNSAHVLGHFYADKNDWPKAETYFLKAVEYGRTSALMCMFESAYRMGKTDRKEFILEKFEEHMLEIIRRPVVSIGYARILIWNNKIEKSISIIKQLDAKLLENIEGNNDEDYKEDIISELSDYFIQLIARGQYNAAIDLFQTGEADYKQLLKPVYFALMHYMQKEYPNEYLKAGNELEETIQEIIEKIEAIKKEN